MNIRPICFLLGGPTLTITDESGRRWCFEDHPYCGPSVVGKRSGAPLVLQPRGRSPFWRAVSLWARQGKRSRGAVAVWDEPPRLRVQHMGGRNYRVLQHQAKGVDYEFSRRRIVGARHGLGHDE